VAGEVLATAFTEGAVGPDARRDDELGLSFSLGRAD
jgi:hypothetical protein